MIVIFSILATILYGVVATISGIGVRRFSPGHPRPVDANSFPPVTIVVAARNEEESLGGCIESLLQQEYPGAVEIIIVDDLSTDATANRAMDFAEQGIVLCSTGVESSELTGKARALDLGFGRASHDWIATTDADCRPPRTWLRGLMQRALDQPDKDMICGCTVVDAYGAPSQIQRLDWLHLLCIASGLSESGLPLTAMGNNMLLKKSAYEDLGGYRGIGDSLTEDFHLFQALGDKAEIIPSPASRNTTVGERSFGKLFLQKQRWLAGGLKAPLWVWTLYLTFALAHLGILATMLIAPSTGVTLAMLKMSFDVLLVVSLATKLGTEISWKWFIPFQIYQFLGVIIIPTLLVAGRGVHWRGRSHRVTVVNPR